MTLLMPAPVATTSKLPALPALTGLRFVAAMAVVIHHYRAVIEFPAWSLPAIDHARTGVDLFFILSGVVLAYNYLDWFRRDLGRLVDYGWARLARIGPLHVLALLLMTPVTLYFYWQSVPPDLLTISWLANLFLVHAYTPQGRFHIWLGPSWSLSGEVFFYVVFPFFVRAVLGRLTRARGLLWLAAGLYVIEVALFIVALAYFVPRVQNGDPYYLDRFLWSPFLRVWEFLIGCVVGVLLLEARRQPDSAVGRWLAGLRLRDGLLLATLALLLGLGFLSAVVADAGPLARYFWTPFVFYTIPFALLIALLASGPTWLGRLLEHPSLKLLGEASYALYLIHWIPLLVLIRATEAEGRPPLVVSLLVLAGTLLTSIALFKTVEQPARRALRDLRRGALPIGRWPRGLL
jgi:peptidoglycan/LPS O-acetylase OafA/YrhL